VSDAPHTRPLSARWLHLLLAVLALGAIACGYIMSDTGWPGTGVIDRTSLYVAHKSMGLLMLPVVVMWALVMVRLVRAPRYSRQHSYSHSYRHFHRHPRLRAATAWVIWAVHAALLVVFMAVALTGWIGSSYGAYGQDVFGVVPFPDIAPRRDVEQSIRFYTAHRQLAQAAGWLLAVHVAGALFHLLIVRDRVFQAMFALRLRAPQRRALR